MKTTLLISDFSMILNVIGEGEMAIQTRVDGVRGGCELARASNITFKGWQIWGP